MYDVIVIGAGCMGTSSAYYAGKSGKKTLLLEQFDFDHTNGSSHGFSRIIRKSYSEPYFVNMMNQAYELWYDLEIESNTKLIVKTGGLDFGRIGDEYLEKTLESCKSSGIEFELLSANEIRERFPMIQIPDDYKGIYQPDAGVLNPYHTLEVFRKQLSTMKVDMKSNEEFLSYSENEDGIMVYTSTGEYRTKKLVLTIGAWIKQFLNTKGLKLNANIWKMTLGYYLSTEPDLFIPKKFPIFIAMDGPIFYGFPILEKPGYIKVAPHFTNEVIDISNRSFEPNQELISQVNSFVQRTFPSIDPNPTELDTCLYTYTPDENFILDFLPNSTNIVIGAGFSGHGFKFTPLIGKTLIDLAFGNDLPFNFNNFKLENQLL